MDDDNDDDDCSGVEVSNFTLFLNGAQVHSHPIQFIPLRLVLTQLVVVFYFGTICCVFFIQKPKWGCCMR